MVKTTRGKLSITKACELVDIARSTLYYKPVAAQDDVWLMNLIRDIWLKYPFYGYRKITCELRVVHHHTINAKCVLRLMRTMQIQALYPKPNTSHKVPGKSVYPYLLKDLSMTSINQAWMVDITYLRLEHGFVYLIAFIDVFSRYVVGWHLSHTLDAQSCVIALFNALKTASPYIINSDQGSQFTSDIWVNALSEMCIRISMTGQGRCIDNVFIERLWRTIKYEAIYLNEYNDFEQLKIGLKRFFKFYNFERYHQALGYLRPADIYFKSSRLTKKIVG